MDLASTKERCSEWLIRYIMGNLGPGWLFELARITKKWKEALYPTKTGILE